jgi:hypothetical protein
VFAFLAFRIDRDPFGMSVVNVLMSGVWVGASDDVHAELAAALYHFTEAVAVAEKLTAVMEGDFSWIERHAAAGGQAGCVGVYTMEIIEPESGIVLAGIVFYKGQLHPAHGASVPLGSLDWLSAGEGESGHQAARSMQKFTPVIHRVCRFTPAGLVLPPVCNWIEWLPGANLGTTKLTCNTPLTSDPAPPA